jgi:hypothetical protein
VREGSGKASAEIEEQIENSADGRIVRFAQPAPETKAQSLAKSTRRPTGCPSTVYTECSSRSQSTNDGGINNTWPRSAAMKF